LGVRGEPGPGTDPREGADAGFSADLRALDMAEGVDGRAVGDLDAGTEDHMRLNSDVAPKLGVECEPHAFGVDQRRAILQCLLAPAVLPLQLQVRELGAAVDAGGFIRIALDDYRRAALRARNGDDVGEVIFAPRVVVADLGEPAE